MAKICRSAIVALLLSATANANPSGDETRSDASALTFSSVATHRFVASHGRKAVLMGYPETGLEFLAYPLQIVSGYQIGFKPEGAATETDARLLLSRVTATPDSVTRIYAGPDYVVRETMFVPLSEPRHSSLTKSIPRIPSISSCISRPCSTSCGRRRWAAKARAGMTPRRPMC